MNTWRFEPTLAWNHALMQPDCVRHSLLIVEEERAVVGWCRLFPVEFCNGSRSELSLGIGLLAPYRDIGIVTSLVQKSLEWALSVGVKRVTLFN